MPKAVELRVKAIMRKGVPRDRAWAIAVGRSQKEGLLRRHSMDLTEAGRRWSKRLLAKHSELDKGAADRAAYTEIARRNKTTPEEVHKVLSFRPGAVPKELRRKHTRYWQMLNEIRFNRHLTRDNLSDKLLMSEFHPEGAKYRAQMLMAKRRGGSYEQYGAIGDKAKKFQEQRIARATKGLIAVPLSHTTAGTSTSAIPVSGSGGGLKKTVKVPGKSRKSKYLPHVIGGTIVGGSLLYAYHKRKKERERQQQKEAAFPKRVSALGSLGGVLAGAGFGSPAQAASHNKAIDMMRAQARQRQAVVRTLRKTNPFPAKDIVRSWSKDRRAKFFESLSADQLRSLRRQWTGK